MTVVGILGQRPREQRGELGNIGPKAERQESLLRPDQPGIQFVRAEAAISLAFGKSRSSFLTFAGAPYFGFTWIFAIMPASS